MRLTAEERALLDGTRGSAQQKAMQIVAALGEIYGAAELIPVGSAQISGVSYKNLGDAGVQFLEEWAALGARACVPAFMNPAGMDLLRWREMGIPAEFARQQQRIVDALSAMGVERTCTCTPYLVGHTPRRGEHLAWSESSAVSYANSVLGACSNREGGPSALAAAITGKTAAYGLHLPGGRRPTHMVDVRCALDSEADYGALGYIVGRRVADGVPYYRMYGQLTAKRPLCPKPSQEQLMALGAAMAASGAVALYHFEDVTPEAAAVAPLAAAGVGRMDGLGAAELPLLTIESLEEGYAALNSPLHAIDFVSLGCPHSTLRDIERAAGLLRGRRVRATLWVTTSRAVRDEAEQRGMVAVIEAAGGKVFADTCLVVAPVEKLGFRAMATNSAKAAFYAPAHSGLERRFGTLEQCIEAAVTGVWA